jgi:hypothetical protein
MVLSCAGRCSPPLNLLRLQMIDDAPPLIAIRGNSAVLAMPMVAIVGARNASAAGVRFAERLARDLGSAGFVIASGSTPARRSARASLNCSGRRRCRSTISSACPAVRRPWYGWFS